MTTPYTPAHPAVIRFAALFAGYEHAHGVFTPTKANERGKVQGRPATVRGGATLDQYALHLTGGGAGLGIIMLREDDTVLFGAIDLDDKNMDHVAAEAAVRRLQLPLVLCRSKSGGGHFYCFPSAPVDAELMRQRLAEWCALLGLAANTEQFPKQSTRVNDSDVGSWINLPYYGVEGTNRYAIAHGKELSLIEFLDHAERSAVDPRLFEESWLKDSSMFPDGPPCLQTLEAQGGFVEGTKKNGMFDVAVYLKKAHPDTWEEHVDEYNTALAQLKSNEIQELVKSVRKKDYTYQCKQPPINSVCQRRTCLTRRYGVGEGDPEQRGVSIGSIIRYESSHGEEPMWSMEVNGKRVLLTTEQLYNRDAFNRACVSQANIIPVHMQPARWLKYLNEMIATAEIVPLPDDASPTGQLWERVVMFLTQQADAKDRSEVVSGKPWRDEKGRVWFRSMDLFSYLDARRVAYKSQQHVWMTLRDRGAGKAFWNLGGKGVNVWSLPNPESAEVASEDAAPVLHQSEEF